VSLVRKRKGEQSLVLSALIVDPSGVAYFFSYYMPDVGRLPFFITQQLTSWLPQVLQV
jgi:hypothetical protein